MVQVDPESRGELPLHHGLPLQLEDPAARQSPGQHVQAFQRVHSGRFQQHDRFRDQAICPADHQLVGRFHDLAGTVRSHVDDGLPDRVEDRQRRREVLGLTTDHDGQ